MLTYGDLIDEARADFINGFFVDVVRGEIYPACVNFRDGKIVRVERKESAPPYYILPGLIDAHVHIESSMLTPYRFAERAVAHGTTSVVANPNGAASVAGMEGIRYMVEDGRRTPLRFYYAAPSSTPSADAGTRGSEIGWKEVRAMLSRDDFVALGEIEDHHAVLDDDAETMAMIEVAREAGKPIDGHCPGLRGYKLDRYVMSGISSEHSSVSPAEAAEKARRGMRIMVREGSSARDLKYMLLFAMENEHLLVTNDLRPSDLMEGHMDNVLRKAVAAGMNPMQAIRAVTLWPARHYKLPGGSLYLGSDADFIVVNDLTEFRVLETWIGGKQVASEGRALFEMAPSFTMGSGIVPINLRAGDLAVPAERGRERVRVIEVLPERVESGAGTAELYAYDGELQPDPSQDVLLMAVVSRYHGSGPAVAFVRGFGLRSGAIASSVAHDAHNLIGVGADPGSLAYALNEVAAQGGGYFAVDGERAYGLELPVGGLMSDRPAEEVAAGEKTMNEAVWGMGSRLYAPFAALSYQSLLSEPELKLSDRGLFDTVRGEYVDPVIGRRRIMLDQRAGAP